MFAVLLISPVCCVRPKAQEHVKQHFQAELYKVGCSHVASSYTTKTVSLCVLRSRKSPLACCAMDPLLRGRRNSMPEGLPGALQVMSPNGPSAMTAPGPQEVGGEHVEGRQGLIPALQASGTANGISPPGREGLVLQASEGNQGLAPSGLAQAPSQGAGRDLVPTRVGGESSPNRTHPFTTALSQEGSTEPFRPVQIEVST